MLMLKFLLVAIIGLSEALDVCRVLTKLDCQMKAALTQVYYENALLVASKNFPFQPQANDKWCYFDFDVPPNEEVVFDIDVFNVGTRDPNKKTCTNAFVSLVDHNQYKIWPNDFCGDESNKKIIFPARNGWWSFRILHTHLQGFANQGFNATVYLKQEVTPAVVDACRCGIDLEDTRIINGINAKPYSIPWQVGLVRAYDPKDEKSRQKPLCGGSIIGPSTILTAGHCVAFFLKTKYPLAIMVSEYDLQNSQDYTRYYEVESMETHPDFNNKNMDNDFAIIKLKQPILFDDKANAVCLFTNPNLNVKGMKMTVSGWGTVSYAGTNNSQILQEALVDGYTNTECLQMLNADQGNSAVAVTNNMLCAGGSKDACQGDSGGPLTATFTDNRNYQIGVTSWGRKCGIPGEPGVYARIAMAIDWIRAKGDDYVKTCSARIN